MRWKANGEARLLLVDGHNSHYMHGFLEFARLAFIHILCYSAHGTHVYQGLDVIVFGVLKLYWTHEKDKWEREKWQKVSKTNFLAIYGAAHKRALTSDIIKMVFEKTGVWPFNRDVVTPEMMAPSLETLCRGHLPVAPSTPVHIVTNLFHQAHHQARVVSLGTQSGYETDNGMETDEPCTPTSSCLINPFATPIQTAIWSLHNT